MEGLLAMSNKEYDRLKIFVVSAVVQIKYKLWVLVVDNAILIKLLISYRNATLDVK